MAAATAVEASALDELRFVLEGVFVRIEQFDQSAPTSLHLLYTALYHQLEDGLMQQEEFEAHRFMALKAWNLKLQLDWVESGAASCEYYLVNVGFSYSKTFVFMCMLSPLRKLKLMYFL